MLAFMGIYSVGPCPQRVIDGVGTVRDDFFACAAEFVVDTLVMMTVRHERYCHKELYMFGFLDTLLSSGHAECCKKRVGQEGCCFAQHRR